MSSKQTRGQLASKKSFLPLGLTKIDVAIKTFADAPNDYVRL